MTWKKNTKKKQQNRTVFDRETEKEKNVYIKSIISVYAWSAQSTLHKKKNLPVSSSLIMYKSCVGTVKTSWMREKKEKSLLLSLLEWTTTREKKEKLCKTLAMKKKIWAKFIEWKVDTCYGEDLGHHVLYIIFLFAFFFAMEKLNFDYFWIFNRLLSLLYLMR